MLQSPTLHELNDSLSQVETYKKSIISLKTLMNVHISSSINFKNSTQDLFSALYPFFSNNDLGLSQYNAFLNTVGVRFDKLFESYNQIMKDLFHQVNEWARVIDTIDKSIDKKNQSKKVYEHYKEKMQNSNNSMNASKVEYKFIKAKEDYDNICNETYYEIKKILSQMQAIVAPFVSKLISTERDFYKNANNIYQQYQEAIENNTISYSNKYNYKNPENISSNTIQYSNNRSLTPELIRNYCNDSNEIVNQQKTGINSMNLSTNKYKKVKIRQKPNYYYNKEFYFSKENSKSNSNLNIY